MRERKGFWVFCPFFDTKHVAFFNNFFSLTESALQQHKKLLLLLLLLLRTFNERNDERDDDSDDDDAVYHGRCEYVVVSKPDSEDYQQRRDR